jgi:protein-tyrosine phosphatase
MTHTKHALFREVPISLPAMGSMFLHSMPGRYEELAQAWEELRQRQIAAIACLAPLNEIKRKSPNYWNALNKNEVPCSILRFGISDYGVPDDEKAFAKFVFDCATRLKAGSNLLIHCGAGIGRTGVLAECILLALGIDANPARLAVKSAGAGAETEEQRKFIRHYKMEE